MVESRFNQQLACDVLVVGGGAAGLLASISASEIMPQVILVDKAKIGRSGCSPFAAGAFRIFFPGEDDMEIWTREIVEGGDFLNDQEWVKLLCQETYGLAMLIDQWGKQRRVQIFERDEAGGLIHKRARAHRRTYECVFKPFPFMDTLRDRAQAGKVKFLERTMVTDLITDGDGKVTGAQGFNYRTGDLYLFRAKAIVLAAGCCGFKSIFLGHKNLTGDLQAAAFRRGAIFRNMEHFSSNTCHQDYDIHGLGLFVSMGGTFVNGRGEDFMWKYQPEFGSRGRRHDLVLAFCREVKEGRGPIFLDLTHTLAADQKLLKKILPQTFLAWERAGVDPFNKPMPWVPAFYGTMGDGGGLDIDLNCRTSIPGLFAAGDVTCLPPGGSGGLSGGAIPYASVSGYLAGQAAAKYAGQAGEMPSRGEGSLEFLNHLFRSSGPGPDELIYQLQKLLITIPVAYLKSRECLELALKEIQTIKSLAAASKAGDLHELVKCLEVNNMVLLAELFLKASLFREESRGFHFREDFPRTDNKNWLKWVLIEKEGEETNIWTQDIPTPYVRPDKEIDVPPGIRRE